MDGRGPRVPEDAQGMCRVGCRVGGYPSDLTGDDGTLARLRDVLRDRVRAAAGRLIWADAVYTGKLAAWAATLTMKLQIVPRRNPHAFEVLPRRWVVERTFAWISKHRRAIRDYERLPASHEAMILRAMTALMARRPARPGHLSSTVHPPGCGT